MEKQSKIFLAGAKLPCCHGPKRWNVRNVTWEWHRRVFWEHRRVVPLLLPTSGSSPRGWACSGFRAASPPRSGHTWKGLGRRRWSKDGKLRFLAFAQFHLLWRSPVPSVSWHSRKAVWEREISHHWVFIPGGFWRNLLAPWGLCDYRAPLDLAAMERLNLGEIGYSTVMCLNSEPEVQG